MRRLKIPLNHKAAQGQSIEAACGWPDIDAKKVVALSVLLGKKKAGPEYRDMERDARVLRWASSSALPNVYKAAVDDNRDSPELTCVSRLLEGAEDACTESLVKFVQEKLGHNVSHLAWEHDGIGLNEGAMEGAPAFVTDVEHHVYEETGYRMHLAVKKERSLLEMLVAGGQQLLGAEEPLRAVELAAYAAVGNCIQAAVVASYGCHKPALPIAASGTRSYREVAEHFELRIEGACITDILLQLASGKALAPVDYLLHSEPRGKPHCVLLRVVFGAEAAQHSYELPGHGCAAGGTWSRIAISPAEFCRAVGSAADKHVTHLFRINGTMAGSTNALLDLAAGACLARDSDVACLAGLHLEVGGEVQLPLAAGDSDEACLAGLLLEDGEENEDPDEPAFMETFCGLLGQEARQYEADIGRSLSRSTCHCSLCPWRSFNRRAQLIEHQKHHRPPKFVASREDDALFRVALSFYRFDCVCSVFSRPVQKNGGYLARAAEQLRDWSRDAPAEALDAARHSNEAHLFFVLTESGPQYWLRAKSGSWTRINAKVAYTKGFEDLLIGLAVVSHGAMNGILDRLHPMVEEWDDPFPGLPGPPAAGSHGPCVLRP